MTNREGMSVYWHLYMTAHAFGPNVERYFLDRFWQEVDALIVEPEAIPGFNPGTTGPEIERDNWRRLKA
jgi:hypothetical protein